MQKLFSIHKPGNSTQSASSVLQVEIGEKHVALQVYNSEQKNITASEYFQLKKNVFLFLDEVLTEVKYNTILLDKMYSKIKVSVLQPEALLVPMPLFDTNEAKENLRRIFKAEANSFYNDMNAKAAIVVAYSLPAITERTINDNFYNAEICHSYSAVLSNLNTYNNDSFFKVIFHGNYFVFAAVKSNQLQILQTYNYVAAEDVLYYLLAVQQQLGFSADDTQLFISGLINQDSALHKLLQQYFHNITFESINDGLIEDTITEDLPLHYFTQAV